MSVCGVVSSKSSLVFGIILVDLAKSGIMAVKAHNFGGVVEVDG